MWPWWMRGVQAAFVRMTGAPLHSMDIATDKAYTAVSFGLPTGQWHEVWPGIRRPCARAWSCDRVLWALAVGGPLWWRARIGGIGVSGGSEQQDEIIAEAGLQALGLVEDQQGG
jgi:uncharacterized protein GlcG (DUF336 family)